jgi:hypothetical protein
MAQTKQLSKRKRRSKAAVPMLSAAGLTLSLASGASAAIGNPTADALTRAAPMNHEITLGEEEISGVSLATFYVSDKETGKKSQRGLRSAMGACGGGCGCGGCGCWTGTYYTSSVVGSEPPPAYNNAPYYEQGYGPRRTHRHKHASKRAHAPKKS